jgi:histidine triad (HIT) family protein
VREEYNPLMDCRFCDITTQAGQIIREGEHTIVFLSKPRLMPGHLLVIPKRHAEKLSDLTKEERAELFNEAAQLQEKVLEMIAPGCDVSQHFRPFIPDSRFKQAHLHVHIRPRALEDELYEKSQKFENDIFMDPSEEELEKYKNLFNN